MKRYTTLLLALLLVPGGLALASTFTGEQNVTLAETPADNAYLVGTTVTVTAPLPADLFALGGDVSVYAPVEGDQLLVGGTIISNKVVAGDVRALGGKIYIEGDVAGDVAVVGGTVTVSSYAKNIYVAGGTVTLSGGASGPVTVYGADVTLGGTYSGDVTIVASDKLTIQEGTQIKGSLRYNAPQQVIVPLSAEIAGATIYTGSYSYVPTNEEARTYAVAGAGIFFIVRALGAMIVAGLLVGLFPIFATAVSDRALAYKRRRTYLLALLGFGLLVATPILALLLLVSFVGAGLALLLGALYLLLGILAYMYAGIIVGAKLRLYVFSKIRGNKKLSWRDGVMGMFVFYLIGMIPYIGSTLTIVVISLALGVITSLCYQFAFKNSAE